MGASFARDGLDRSDRDFLIGAYDGLGRLISGPRCRLETLLKVDDVSRSTIWFSKEYGCPTGALLIVPLNADGARAAADHAFDGLSPDLSHVCAPGDPLFGFYGWLFAGATPLSRYRVLRGAKRVCAGEFGAVPVFARAASKAGESTLLKLGFAASERDPAYFQLLPTEFRLIA